MVQERILVQVTLHEQHFERSSSRTNEFKAVGLSFNIETSLLEGILRRVLSQKYRQKMLEPARVLGWNTLIPLSKNVYSDLVRYFYCNLEVGNLDNAEFTIDSYVRGKHIILNPTILSQIIGVPNDGELIFLEKPSQLKNHVNKTEMNETVSIHGTVGASQHKELKKEFRLFHKFISYNVTPKHGHHNQVSTMENFIIYRSAIEDPLNLNYIILREMAYVRTHKNRSLPYGALLTKIFEHFEVNLRNQSIQTIDEGFSSYMISRGITLTPRMKRTILKCHLKPWVMYHLTPKSHMNKVLSHKRDKPPKKTLLTGSFSILVNYAPQWRESSRTQMENYDYMKARMDSIEQRQILNDKLHELHGTYIDRLGDNYEQLYTQQTEFHQECLDRLKAVQTLMEAEFHFQYDPPPFSPHSQALMNLKGTKRKQQFLTSPPIFFFDEDTKGEKNLSKRHT
ncbi:hypothetical protein Acr_10g0007310 [Actinidia rufa]|uniref:Putative plant transposon protein domain-containing protein n=1 Tax=Actinidia rufa TaxID=165716 RepID=A0A7J0FA88_9ERIC|nr:hypothetical protein Acr_10g0007310 [Actinidia rufa]